jgi:hypothetical protein
MVATLSVALMARSRTHSRSSADGMDGNITRQHPAADVTLNDTYFFAIFALSSVNQFST